MLCNKCLMMLFSFSQRGKWNWILHSLTADRLLFSSSGYGTVFIYWSWAKMTVNVVRENPGNRLRHYKVADNLPGHIHRGRGWNESSISGEKCLFVCEHSMIKIVSFQSHSYIHTLMCRKWEAIMFSTARLFFISLRCNTHCCDCLSRACVLSQQYRGPPVCRSTVWPPECQ